MNHDIEDSFREELLELIETLEAGLLALETPSAREGLDRERLGDVFRAAHNIKSAAAMLGIVEAADAAHAMESVLDEARSTGVLDQGTVTQLLRGVDTLRAAVQGRALPRGVARAPRDESSPRDLRLRLAFSEDAFAAALDPLALLRACGDLGTVVSVSTDDSRLPPLDALDPARLYLGFELVLRTTASTDDVRSVFLFAEDHLDLELDELPAGADPPEAGGALPRAAARRGAAPESGAAAPAPLREARADPLRRPEGLETLLVGVRRVDTLVDLAAEMSIAVSQLERSLGQGPSPSEGRIEGAFREVKRLAGRLQEAAMAMRLVPLATTFAMLRRFIRDQSLHLGKDVAVEIQGAHTELDKSVAERLMDPLKHLVRNALDHGLEPPGEREQAGKPRRGRLLLSALQEQGEVILVVEDDGRGIDPDRIRERAVQKGLIKADGALSDAEAQELVFLPAFSTAEAVGELSGRGVGLDVVRRNVVELGGAVRLDSAPGRGTRFSLHVPLTLAVLEGLVLRCGGERLVVPIDRVRSLVRPKPGQIARLPEGREILRLPDRSVPLMRATSLFGAEAAGSAGDAVAVVVDTTVGPVALHADDVISQEAVMLKPLQRSLRVGGEGVLGAAVLGDGGVALILDVARLAALGGREPAARSPFTRTP